MPVQIVPQAEVPRLLPMGECVEVMAEALRTLARGDAVLPLRSMVRTPDQAGLLGLMPGYLGAPRCLGIKVVTVFPGNEGGPLDSHQGAVLLFEAEHGSLLAVVDASSITAVRTAAVSGVATRALAREDAGDLAILGSGVQATTHLDAMRAVRALRRVRVWSRNGDHARAYAERESRRHGLRVEVMPSAAQAVEGADLVCTTTSSREPVLRGEWLAAGAHVNAVGACFPHTRELDTAAVRRSLLYVDRRESCLSEAGDFLIPRREGALGDDHIVGELGDVLLGRVPGRGERDEVTLFKSLGIAVEDLAAVHHVWRKAQAERRPAVDLGGHRLA